MQTLFNANTTYTEAICFYKNTFLVNSKVHFSTDFSEMCQKKKSSSAHSHLVLFPVYSGQNFAAAVMQVLKSNNTLHITRAYEEHPRRCAGVKVDRYMRVGGSGGQRFRRGSEVYM